LNVQNLLIGKVGSHDPGLLNEEAKGSARVGRNRYCTV